MVESIDKHCTYVNFKVLYFSISFCYFILSLACTSEANIDVFTTVDVLLAVVTMQTLQTKQHIKYDALCYDQITSQLDR